MKTDTQNLILRLIKTKQRVRPAELIAELGISNVAIHKQLKKMVDLKLILKVGTAPSVFYVSNNLIENRKKDINQKNISLDVIEIIDQNYLYISPSGEIITGLSGFFSWAKQIKQDKNIPQLALEYAQTRKSANLFFQPEGWIDATDKLSHTFPNQKAIDTVLYQDFYALPKFGKTKLGQLVLHAKQAQHQDLIKKIALIIKSNLQKIIDHYQIEAVAFIPHSIPRKIPFLKEMRTQLQLHIPEIRLVKAYSGELPVAQKSLSKLEERIQNARDTIFIQDSDIPYQNILLIDDAVGSGATFIETAKKLKHNAAVNQVVGFAIVGSMKGFEVIQEV